MFQINVKDAQGRATEIFGLTPERIDQLIAAAGKDFTDRCFSLTDDLQVKIEISRVVCIQVAAAHADTAEEYTFLLLHFIDKMDELAEMAQGKTPMFSKLITSMIEIKRKREESK